MLRVSLAQKIAFPVAALVLLLQFGLGAYALDHERRTLLRQLDARATRLANIREALALYEDPRDTKHIAQWLGTTLLDQKDVLFCEVKAADGQTLFRGGDLESESSRRYSFLLAAPRSVAGHVDAKAEDRSSASGTSRGTLHLALSTADIAEALSEARGALVIGVLAGTGFALLVTLLIVRYTVGNTMTRLLKTVRMASIRHLGGATTSRTGDALEQLDAMLHSLTAELREIVEKEKRLTAETMVKQGQHEETVR